MLRALVVGLGLLAICGRPPPGAAPSNPASPAATEPAAPRETPTAFPDLNLGFEAGGEAPNGWTLDAVGYTVEVDPDVRHRGARSLRMRQHGVRASGEATLALPPRRVAGAAVVLSGFVRSASTVHGRPRLKLVARRGLDTLAVARSAGPEPAGDSDWTRTEVRLDVPTDADAVVVAVVHDGDGTAWFDSLDVRVVHASPGAGPRATVVQRGLVHDEVGKPVAGATVVLGRPGQPPSAIAQTAADGSFDAEIAPGTYTLTATRGAAGMGFVPEHAVDAKRPVRVPLRAQAGLRVHGTVRDQRRRPVPDAEIRVSVARSPAPFVTRTDSTGAFELFALTAQAARVLATKPGYLSAGEVIRVESGGSGELRADLALHRRVEAPAAVTRWARARAIELAHTDVGRDSRDLARLRRLLKGVRVVGLGEASLGTHEFLALKHRVFAFLVEQMGFTALAVEANVPECRAIDAYIQGADGDPRAVLEALGVWSLYTPEFLALIEWMRAYNADDAHTRKLGFYGIDVQHSSVSARGAAAYLAEHNKVGVPSPALALFASPWGVQDYFALGKSGWSHIEQDLADLLQQIDADRDQLVAATSQRAWAEARENLVLLADLARTPSDGEARDAAMARNVRAILRRGPAGAKIAVWAHNAHVQRVGDGARAMGSQLAKAFGRRYAAIGMTFGRGAMQARAIEGSAVAGLRAFKVDPAPLGNVEHMLAQLDRPLLLLPLRRVPRRGAVADYFRSPVPMREVGPTYAADRDADFHRTRALAEAFDALIFVADATRARPLKPVD